LSKDGNNKIHIGVTVYGMFSKESFYGCSLPLWDALVAIVLIQLIEIFETILEGITSVVYPGIVEKIFG
jgi:hypothetical protein